MPLAPNFFAQVVVLDCERMHGTRERLGHGTVVVAFLPKALDPDFRGGDLFVELDFAGGRPELGYDSPLRPPC